MQEKVEKLLNILISQTQANILKWRMANGINAYILIISSYIVLIKKEETEDKNNYTIQITENGENLYSATYTSQSEHAYFLLKELYDNILMHV